MLSLAPLYLVPIVASLLSRLPLSIQLVRLLMVCCGWLQLGFSLYICAPVWHTQTQLRFGEDFFLDRGGASFLLLTNFVVAGSLTHSIYFFANEAKLTTSESANEAWFYTFSMLFLLAMDSIFIVDNLGFLWISIEATTLSSAALVYYSRDKHALEATWKYLMVCSLGIAFALFGTILFFAASQSGGSVGTLSFNALCSSAKKLHPKFLQLGYIFCLLGYGTKAGIFPLHTWLPDAHSEAPAPASAMLSGSLLNCALYAIWKLTLLVKLSTHHDLATNVPIIWGTLTALAASLFLINQRNIKRLWAYSSIENVGIMLVTIGLGALPLFLLHAVNHSLSKSALFLVSGNLIQASGSKDIRCINQLAQVSPLTAVCLASAALAVTGMPPFGAFVSEWLILTKVSDQSHILCVVCLLAALMISFMSICAHICQLIGEKFTGSRQDKPLCSPCLIPFLFCLCTLILGTCNVSETILSIR